MNGVSRMDIYEDITLVTFHKVPADLALIAGIFSDFAKSGINIDMISQTAAQGNQIDISFTMQSQSLVKALELVKEVQRLHPSLRPMVSSGNCKIRLYGQEMREMCGVAAAAISAVSQTGAQLTLITTSEVDISLLVTQPHMQDAVTALEKQFAVKAAMDE